MRRRSRRALWAGLVGCLVGCAVLVSEPVADAPTVAAAVPAAPVPVRVLQMNLCSSGIAGCYTGRSTTEAAAVIRAETPDLVTLNEVCQDDVSTLQRALAGVAPGGAATAAFQPARDERTRAPYRCRNGQQYGIGLISRWPSAPGTSGIYPTQDAMDPEKRAWLCLDVAATPAIAVCTTHLAYTKREVARAQCRYLLDTVVAQRRARNARPVVLGADLNLGSSGDPDLASCVPAGSARADDGGQQHVVATPELVVDSVRTIDLRGTTDHPGLLVMLTHRPRQPPPEAGGVVR